MKVLIITGYAGSWPYIPEMIDELIKLHIDVYILDIDEYIIFNPALDFKCKITPMFNGTDFFKALFIIRLLKKARIDFDIVNMHYIYGFYKYVVLYCKMKKIKTVATIWGWDFYKIDNKKRQKLKRLFKNVDCITFNDERIKKAFLDYYNKNYEDKTKILRFGLGLIDKMRLISFKKSFYDIKKIIGIPENYYVIAIGYNALPEQQHLIMIEELNKISQDAKNKCFILLQLTYPDNNDYVNLIKKRIGETGIMYKIFNEKLPEEEVCYIRLVSDVVVNIQLTDSFSGSLQEHAFAGAKMILGEWLYYKSFEGTDVNIDYINKSHEISSLLEKYIKKYRPHEKYYMNESVYRLSSWKYNIDKWVNVYNELYKQKSNT